ncbi:hypothetical protein F4820DRAFT_97163 [Hypoxylon rubiginosum]|uniref:Uncharacterized protein n=1 Tax=Hypoxylon rubiginosum TaxID=110542 RepID=A0ACB9YNM0_9PEZI|nr:hypothetical protein F4820DRAFT_97163 [Hypoxylon rubiginosum]
MGHKSKFTFPMPGRSSKQPPTVTVTNPLSKAEKILGTGRMNLGSPTGAREHGRSWETGSNGGISISISESSASQSGVLEGDEDVFAGTTYGRSLWEEESEALPRRLRSTNGLFGKSLKTKRSAITLGARSRDAATDDSHSRRPQSSSTAYSHYEPAKVPLSISQQTSNSAMAKGLPTKAGALLDIDGALSGKGQPRKKPAKLDFSKLRFRSRKDHGLDVNGVGPVLGNNYVMRSPSIMSHMSHSIVSPTRPSPTSSGRSQITPKPDMKLQSQPTIGATTRSGRLKGTNDANTLHQLYDHYEQMSFRHGIDLTEEDSEDEARGEEPQLSQQRLLPRTYEPAVPEVSRKDTVTPTANPMNRDPNARWNHSRNTSQASKITATRTGTPSTMQLRPTSRHDYPPSVSSRHTRTSKATPSIMSTLDSDRQQQSVLSLTDSDSDEEGSRPGSSLPSYENSFRDDLSVSSSQRHPSTSRLSVSSHSTNPKGASYAHLNDYLTIPHASPKSKTSRSPSTNTLQSSTSSLSTATRTSLPSHQDPRASVSTTGTTGSLLSPTYSNQSSYTVQEARAVAFTPLASTAEAASSVSVDHMPNSLNQILSQQARQRTSQNSRASDQPTPPLSPTSVEFYRKSPESVRQEPATGSASEPHNARLMAVTRQEEMLLAALRKKRARMRENIIAEIEEDRSLSSQASNDIAGIEKMVSANLKSIERQEARDARARAKQPKNLPTRSSSLQRASNGLGRFPVRSNALPSTSHSDPTEKTTNRTRITSEVERHRTGKARHERVLLYLDRPIDSIDVIDQAEPSPDLSEFLEDDIDFPPNGERRSRTRSKLGSSPHGSPYNSKNSGREAHGRPRPDSSPVSPKSKPVKNVPIARVETNEDIDADDVDFDDLEDVVDQRKAAFGPRSVPEKGIPRPDSPVSPANGLLAPSTLGHKKGKKSAVRLSAVGQISSPVPWWGDDD